MPCHGHGAVVCNPCLFVLLLALVFHVCVDNCTNDKTCSNACEYQHVTPPNEKPRVFTRGCVWPASNVAIVGASMRPCTGYLRQAPIMASCSCSLMRERTKRSLFKNVDSAPRLSVRQAILKNNPAPVRTLRSLLIRPPMKNPCVYTGLLLIECPIVNRLNSSPPDSLSRDVHLAWLACRLALPCELSESPEVSRARLTSLINSYGRNRPYLTPTRANRPNLLPARSLYWVTL